ncbi:MAG: transcription antitermination factor NusB [Oscillospiraceae bacterium]|nr:transcription antitermination factor NusB [Oscillospiraceae bacterium]
MTRTAARELAVLLCASLAPEDDAEAAAERFFEPEHYATLLGEGEQFSQTPDRRQGEYIRAIVRETQARRGELDLLIGQYSRGWRVSRLSRTTAAILRCAVVEMQSVEDVPLSAAIDEAVELAKKYEGPETGAFVNGVLGGIARGEQPAEEDAPEAD